MQGHQLAFGGLPCRVAGLVPAAEYQAASERHLRGHEGIRNARFMNLALLAASEALQVGPVACGSLVQQPCVCGSFSLAACRLQHPFVCQGIRPGSESWRKTSPLAEADPGPGCRVEPHRGQRPGCDGGGHRLWHELHG